MTGGVEIERAAFQADVAVFISLMESEAEAHWKQAEWAAAMAVKYGRETARLLAGEVGLSTVYIRHLIATAKAFPTPESRAQDLSFTHHRIAAMTEDPQGWIERAAAEGLSVAQLRELTKKSRDRMAMADMARRAEERLVRLAREYNEEFSETTRTRVELVWTTLP
jgi:hypothetical protein